MKQIFQKKSFSELHNTESLGGQISFIKNKTLELTSDDLKLIHNQHLSLVSKHVNEYVDIKDNKIFPLRVIGSLALSVFLTAYSGQELEKIDVGNNNLTEYDGSTFILKTRGNVSAPSVLYTNDNKQGYIYDCNNTGGSNYECSELDKNQARGALDKEIQSIKATAQYHLDEVVTACNAIKSHKFISMKKCNIPTGQMNIHFDKGFTLSKAFLSMNNINRNLDSNGKTKSQMPYGDYMEKLSLVNISMSNKDTLNNAKPKTIYSNIANTQIFEDKLAMQASTIAVLFSLLISLSGVSVRKTATKNIEKWKQKVNWVTPSI